VRAVKYEGNKRFGIADLPRPVPGQGQVLVAVTASAICASERGRYSAGEPCPSNTGHEAVGVVADPNGSRRWKEGDRVAVYPVWGCGRCLACGRLEPTQCRNRTGMGPGHSESIAVPEQYLMPIPPPLDDGAALGLLGCGVGVAYGGAMALGVGGVRTVLVAGMGPVGLASLMVHRFLGARVIAMEVQPWRIQKALELGAHAIINPNEVDPVEAARELTDGNGPEGCIECSGHGRALKSCISAVRVGGTVVVIGSSVIDDLNAARDLYTRYVTIRGSWHFFLRQVPEISALVDLDLDPGKIVTHRLPYSRAQEAYDLFEAGETGKVVLYPD
jgi:L-iditol 2-dehydrogenase